MPAGSTYEPIATQTLGSAAATVTFSSIPGTYTDLLLVSTVRYVIGGGESVVQCQVNSDSAGNYSRTRLIGTGSAATTDRSSNNTDFIVGSGTDTANEWAVGIANFINYSNTTAYKSVLTRTNVTSSRVMAIIGNWRNTAAITSFLLANNSGGNFSAGSTFTLYGIKAA
jgi:hypothetical protein